MEISAISFLSCIRTRTVSISPHPPSLTKENFTKTPQLHRRSVLVGRLCFSVIQHSLSLFPLQSKARAEESNHKKEVAMDSVGRIFANENSGGRTAGGASASQLGSEFILAHNNACKAAQARFYIYSSAAVSKNSFEDE